MPEAWYIDALDARSGYAFVSHRVADLDSDDVLPDNGDAFFIEAPHFAPERVGSRAVAFGATRGAFQTGLYLNGAEVPFPTLSAVSEFVRRAYGSGGGADDGGGGTPAAAGPEGPDSPSVPGLGGENREHPSSEDGPEGIEPVQSLINAFTAFAETARAAPAATVVAQAIPFDERIAPASDYNETSARRLARAALRLILEAAWFPEPAKRDEQWVINASRQRLYECISRMGIWIHLCELIRVDMPTRHPAEEAVKRLLGQSRVETIFTRARDLDETAVSIVDFFRIWLCFGIAHYPIHGDLPVVDVSLDRFSDLSHILIPPRLIPRQYRPARSAPTLRNLIAFACHSPTQVDGPLDEVCETLLFGACYLNAPAGSNFRKANSWRYQWPAPVFEHDLMDANRMVAAAMPWLKANLPRYLFNDELEKIIASTCYDRQTSDLNRGAA